MASTPTATICCESVVTATTEGILSVKPSFLQNLFQSVKGKPHHVVVIALVTRHKVTIVLYAVGSRLAERLSAIHIARYLVTAQLAKMHLCAVAKQPHANGAENAYARVHKVDVSAERAQHGNGVVAILGFAQYPAVKVYHRVAPHHDADRRRY